MTARLIVFAMACCLVAGATHNSPSPSSSDQRDPAQRVTLDAVLAAYIGGDLDIVSRSFGRSRDFPDRLRLNDPREFEHWLLGSWDRRKALLLIEIARATAQVSPRFPRVVVDAGRRYVLTAGRGELATPEAAAPVHLWHRAAVALLQRFGTSVQVEEYVRDVSRTGAPLDARLVLARAVAQERTCWDYRPLLDQSDIQTDVLLRAAGMKVHAELSGLPPALRAAKLIAHKTCLSDALTLFEAAAAMDDTRDEARVRGGWVLFQLDRFQEALEWLDATAPRDDRDLTYWRILFRGRVLESLDRLQEALSAYENAQALYPGAQSAGIGHVLLLMRLDRATEADTDARALRASTTTDPWLIYPTGDHRFLDRWVDQLRKAWR